jgi:hypothetical protein
VGSIGTALLSAFSFSTHLGASGKETTHYYELYGQVIFYLPLSHCFLYFFFSHITSQACATAKVKTMTIFFTESLNLGRK